MSLKEKTTSLLALELFLASFVILFQELTFIRWLSSQIRVVAYFPNLILLSTFLGMGLGCLRAGKSSLLRLWPISLLLITVAGLILGNVIFTHESTSEYLWLLYYDLPQNAPIIRNIEIPIIICFILSTVSFMTMGQIVAERLEEFRKRSSALWGYSWDLAGSLIGVISFTIAGFLGTFPVIWFAVFLTAAYPFFFQHRPFRIFYPIIALGIITLIHTTERSEIYSPYYAMNVQSTTDGEFFILTNGSLHQRALNFTPGLETKSEERHKAVPGYLAPYQLLEKPPRKALVFGAGSGNDVAALLRSGAEHIDAVEIDPEILNIGKNHPSNPYSSPRVRVINTDARSFLNNTSEKYDLIVFGTLDSMTKLSALSNVRLDNFVYTQESIELARDHLTPDGGLVMYFMVGAKYIHFRLLGMLTEAFQQVPLNHQGDRYLFNQAYMAGPAFEKYEGSERREALKLFRSRILPTIELPTDDWPYLYLKNRGVSVFYLSIMGTILFIAFLGVFFSSGSIKRFRAMRFDGQMFLFGLAFLLIETQSVTSMNLLWGTTWLTSAVVFGSILAMILLATILTERKPLSFTTGILGLIVSILFAYFFPIQILPGSDLVTKLLFSCLLIGVPIGFASISFAVLFRKRKDAANAFAWNILGAVCGGLLEFLSMLLGFRSLLLLGLAAYLIAYLLFLSEQRKKLA